MYQSHLKGNHKSQYGQKTGYNAEKNLSAESDCVHTRKRGLNLRLQVIYSVNNMHGEGGREKRITERHIATSLKKSQSIFSTPK